MVELDSVTDAAVWLLRFNGYAVEISVADGTYHAVASKGTERRETSGTDVYAVVCQLAEDCGMELDDC